MTLQGTSYVLSDWLPLYHGIDYASGAAVNALDVSQPVTRIQHVNVLRVNLSTPGISFYSTPPGGKLDTLGQTITDFLTCHPDVRVAINANFFHPVMLKPGYDCSLFGLAISQGTIVSPATKLAPGPSSQNMVMESHDLLNDPANMPNEKRGDATLLVTKDNRVSFQAATATSPIDPSCYYTAVAGSPFLIKEGTRMAESSNCPPESIAARTAVALGGNENLLYLLTINGRKGSEPQYGAAYYDVAQWLTLIDGGIQTAVNFDGGGSTAMAKSDLVNGKPVVTLISVPYGDDHTAGFQRPVGNHLGVCADPLEGS